MKVLYADKTPVKAEVAFLRNHQEDLVAAKKLLKEAKKAEDKIKGFVESDIQEGVDVVLTDGEDNPVLKAKASKNSQAKWNINTALIYALWNTPAEIRERVKNYFSLAFVSKLGLAEDVRDRIEVEISVLQNGGHAGAARAENPEKVFAPVEGTKSFSCSIELV